MSTPWTLPAWHAVADLNERDALQDFIYHQSPAGDDEVAWREHLRAAIMVAHEELCARQARMSDHRSSPADPSATSSMQPRLSGAEVAGDRQAFIKNAPDCPKFEPESNQSLAHCPKDSLTRCNNLDASLCCGGGAGEDCHCGWCHPKSTQKKSD